MNKQHTAHSMIVTFLLLAVALVLPGDIMAAAGSAIVCAPSTSCEVGEFLYDDEYTPIITASCTFTSRDPSGTLLHNGVAMASASDGWYSHTFTAPATEGFYRTQICCTAGTDYLCLDKSFEVKNQDALTSTEVADSVWNASKSSYTTSGSFGESLQNSVESSSDIATAVWSYSTRTISSFASIAADVWSYSTRLLTGTTLEDGGKLASKSDVNSVQDTVNDIESTVNSIEDDTSDLETIVKDTETLIRETNTATTTTEADIAELKSITLQNQVLLDKVINKPIIETVIEEADNDLRAKLESSLLTANDLYLDTRLVRSKIQKLSAEWRTASTSRKLSLLNEISSIVGEETDKENTLSMVGAAYWTGSQWTQEPAQDIADTTMLLSQSVSLLQKKLATQDVSVRELDILTRYNDRIALLVGDVSDDTSALTLYGTLAEVFELAYAFDEINNDLSSLLSQWNIREIQFKQRTLRDLRTRLTALNVIPRGTLVLSAYDSKLNANDVDLQNSMYSMQGLIVANKRYLAKTAEVPIATTWLEVGSIVFKSLVTNPSKLVEQQAELKYYLPEEIKEEHILEVDESVSIKFDAERNQYYVYGLFDLAPGETVTVSTRTQDIWEISEDEIESLRQQAEELARPLEKTSFFGQSVTIKSDIVSTLDKVLIRQEEALTPEAKVRAYRESQVDLESVRNNLEELEKLLGQAESTGSLFGFVGATQTLAVWGLIVIIASGFIFMMLFMRKISNQQDQVQEEETKKSKKKTKKTVEVKKDQPQSMHVSFPFGASPTSLIVFLAYGVFLVLLVVFVVSTFMQSRDVSNSSDTPVLGAVDVAVEEQEVSTSSLENVACAASIEESSDEESTSPRQKRQKVAIAADGTAGIRLRENASYDAEVVDLIVAETEGYNIGVDGEWVHVVEIAGNEDLDGWIHKDFVVSMDGEGLLEEFAEETEEVLGVTDESKAVEAETAEEEIEVESTAGVKMIVTETGTGWLRVRKSPSGQEITKIDVGTKLTGFETELGWTAVELKDGTEGYVSAQYLSEM